MFPLLLKTLNERKKDLAIEIAEQLHSSSSKHYSLIAPVDLIPYTQELLDNLIKSIKENNECIFFNYIEQITIKGFKEDYNISELQNNLNLLSDTLITMVCNKPDKKEELNYIIKLILSAKDKMSKTYMDQYTQIEQKLDHLRQEFEEFLQSRKNIKQTKKER